MRIGTLLVVLLGASACLSVHRGDDGRVHLLSDSLRASLPAPATVGESLPPAPGSERVAELRPRMERALGAAASRTSYDPSLDHVARVQALAYNDVTQRLSAELLHYLHWRTGGVHAIAGWKQTWASGSGRAAVVDEAIAKFASSAPKEGRARYGLARAVSGRRIASAILWVRDDVTLEPTPRVAAPGATLSLRGGLSYAAEHLRVYVDDGASVRRVDATLDDSKRFAVDVELGAEAGARMIEVVSERAGRPGENRSHAWWPVYVGVAPPAAEPNAPIGATTPTVEALEAHVRALRGEGPPAVRRDASLDLLAAASLAAEGDDAPFQPDDDGCRRRWERVPSGSETMEELVWRHSQSPLVKSMARNDGVTRLGVAVRQDGEDVLSCFLLCADAAAAAAP